MDYYYTTTPGSDLGDCPFCGIKGSERDGPSMTTSDQGRKVYHGKFALYVNCTNCGAQGPSIAIGFEAPTPEEAERMAAAAWNARGPVHREAEHAAAYVAMTIKEFAADYTAKLLGKERP